jgi:hypothetical protein
MALSWLAKILRSSRQHARKPRARYQPELEYLERRITPQATRTWVSGVGDDANPCSRTAPGKTFAGAIAKTAAGGEIDALDSGGFGALTITKSITIDGGNNLASVLVSSGNGIVINAADTDVIVLRHLKFQGLNGTASAGLNAIRILKAGEVHIEDCDIQNFGNVGIDWESSTSGGKLFVSDTNILNNQGGGFLMKPNAVPATAQLDHVFALHNLFGFKAQDQADVTISNSVASGNTQNGFQTVTTASAARMHLNSDLASENEQNGISSDGTNSQVTLTDVTSVGNWSEGIATPNGGNLFSFGTNRIADNALGATTLGSGQGTQGGGATRTWVSGVGDDANPCSRTAPGKTFAGAIGKTTVGGEIDALDPGGFGAVTITAAYTIDGTGAFASILAPGTNAIIINAGASDVVIIRGLSLNGFNTTSLNGIKILGAGAVIVENCAIQNFGQNGIDFEPTNAGAMLFVENSVIRNNTGAGILIKPNAVHALAMIDGVQADQNNVGIQVQDNADVSISHSSASGNTTNGFEVDASTTSSVMTLESDTAANNGSSGVLAKGPAGGSSTISATALLSNFTATSNGLMGLQAASANPPDSFIVALNSNIRLSANAGGDGAPTGNFFAQHFIEALYLDDLGRAASTAEINGWVMMFNSPGNSTTTVATRFARQSEVLDHLVQSWYVTYLGRTANGGEEMGFVNELVQGQSQEQVLSNLLGDPGHEFFNRAQALVSSGTPQERYVQALYMLLLHRTGSASEITGWVNNIPMVGLIGVALQIQQTGEYRTIVVSGYYNVLLHRPPDVYGDMGGLNAWVFMSNQDLYTIRTAFEGTSEFFANG